MAPKLLGSPKSKLLKIKILCFQDLLDEKGAAKYSEQIKGNNRKDVIKIGKKIKDNEIEIENINFKCRT